MVTKIVILTFYKMPFSVYKFTGMFYGTIGNVLKILTLDL